VKVLTELKQYDMAIELALSHEVGVAFPLTFNIKDILDGMFVDIP